jgi:hypothetical protein
VNSAFNSGAGALGVTSYAAVRRTPGLRLTADSRSQFFAAASSCGFLMDARGREGPWFGYGQTQKTFRGAAAAAGGNLGFPVDVSVRNCGTRDVP